MRIAYPAAFLAMLVEGAWRGAPPRSAVLAGAAVLHVGVDGVELLPPSRVRLATEPQKPDHPENDDYPRNWVLGYRLGGAT